MQLRQYRPFIVHIFSTISQKNIFSFAAALSYYVVMAFFPALITVTTTLGLMRIADLSHTIVATMARVVPRQSLALVERVASDVTSGQHDTWFSFGLLATLWTCSSAFATMIEALNAAYEVAEERPMWKTRLLAVWLTFLVGFLIAIGFAIMIVGPHFGRFLAHYLGLSTAFGVFWPLWQHGTAAILIVLALEALYVMAPNAAWSFSSSLPGAIFAAIGWILLSDGLSLYFQNFAHLNRTYGVLGGGIALLVWLYWSGFVILLGAEVNSTLNKMRSGSISI